MTLSRVEKLQLLSFIERSPNRMKILDLLQDNDVFTPTEISKETDISKQNVSRNLRKLQEKELVSCINPDSHKYKYFEITERGETMLEEKEKR